MSGQDGGYIEPLVEVRETGKEIEVYVDLPFVEDSKDVRVELTEDGELEVTASMRRSIKWERWGTYQRFQAFSQYRTRIRLPADVDAEGAKATFRNGVLKVVLPKKVRRINVNVE
ncbi:MAG: Hsp20/alpha crystallin family protein [Conexivisphaera sp.]